jgi:RNA polymerase-binding transcription factor DksA
MLNHLARQEFSNSEKVPRTDYYRCSTCGSEIEFEKGDDFPICDSCGDQEANWELLSSSQEEE